jgi:hypothetical protein
VRDGEVHATLYHGGARTPYDTVFLRYIAKVLHPEAFADVDPSAEYLPVRPEGVFVLGLGGAGQFVFWFFGSLPRPDLSARLLPAQIMISSG